MRSSVQFRFECAQSGRPFYIQTQPGDMVCKEVKWEGISNSRDIIHFRTTDDRMLKAALEAAPKQGWITVCHFESQSSHVGLVWSEMIPDIYCDNLIDRRKPSWWLDFWMKQKPILPVEEKTSRFERILDLGVIY